MFYGGVSKDGRVEEGLQYEAVELVEHVEHDNVVFFVPRDWYGPVY